MKKKFKVNFLKKHFAIIVSFLIFLILIVLFLILLLIVNLEWYTALSLTGSFATITGLFIAAVNKIRSSQSSKLAKENNEVTQKMLIKMNEKINSIINKKDEE